MINSVVHHTINHSSEQKKGVDLSFAFTGSLRNTRLYTRSVHTTRCKHFHIVYSQGSSKTYRQTLFRLSKSVSQALFEREIIVNAWFINMSICSLFLFLVVFYWFVCKDKELIFVFCIIIYLSTLFRNFIRLERTQNDKLLIFKIL